MGACITVPLGPVPFTLQTLMVGIVVCLLPPAYSVAAVGGYLALGCLGLPVFSGLRGGIGVLAGPTGGFLAGFLLAAVVIAVLRSSLLLATDNAAQAAKTAPTAKEATARGTRRSSRILPLLDLLSLLVFSLLYYTLGCLWFMVSTGATLEAALAACVLPFVIPDLLKSVAAFVCVQPVRAALGVQLHA
ncbi:MAG: biotin transporter BioY [Coriobacteriales bacterium]|nr:biotin transporter BioY [Coriobacteriales bacterium]